MRAMKTSILRWCDFISDCVDDTCSDQTGWRLRLKHARRTSQMPPLFARTSSQGLKELNTTDAGKSDECWFGFTPHANASSGRNTPTR